jgi:MYXO-CTERM domain-containing protein
MSTIRGRKLALVLVSAVLLLALPVQQVFAASVGIDNFNTSQEVQDPPDSPPPQNLAMDTAVAVGGERDMQVSRTSGDADVQAVSGVGGDVMGYSQGTVTFGTLEIVWDGNDDDATSIDYTGLSAASVDLTDGGANNGFYIRLIEDDQAATMTLTVYEDASNYSSCDYSLPGSVFTPQTIFIDFTDGCWIDTNSGTDFVDIGAIRLYVDGSSVSALDVTLDWIQTDESSPTAITLSAVGAQAGPTVLIGVAFGLVGLVALGALVVVRRRQT